MPRKDIKQRINWLKDRKNKLQNQKKRDSRTDRGGWRFHQRDPTETNQTRKQRFNHIARAQG